MRKIIYITTLLISQILFGQNETKTEIINVEGFYFGGDEYSYFMEIDLDNATLDGEHWTEFVNGVSIPGDEVSIEGAYMKVNAIRKSGKVCYGHLGAWKSEIIISEIVQIDPNRTLTDYLKQHKLIRKK